MKKLILFLTLLPLLILGYFYKTHAFSFRFVDEEDNFAIGKYLLRGEVLYDDIITNHQPLTYIFSSFVQNYTNPNTTYLLISKHREAMIIWSVVWSLFLVFYFGLGALIVVFIYELTKIYLLGNLFLAEAQVVYPLMFLLGLVIFSKDKLNRWELFFLSFCFSLSVFLLSPIWPTLALLFFILLYQQKRNLVPALAHILTGAILPLLIVYKFTSIPGYFSSIYLNLVYTVPGYQSQSWLTTSLKAFLTPILAFSPIDAGPTISVTRVFSLLLVINLLVLVNNKKYFKATVIFISLGLTNLRFVEPGDQLYSGFHLLPWYVSLIFLTSLLLVDNFREKPHWLLKLVNVGLIIFVAGLSLNFTRTDLFHKRNVLSDYNLNYSTHTSRGEAIRIMKDQGDTLFVSPNAWLVYWQSDVDHLPKLYGYYAWMAGIPKVHSAILEAFENSPPAYFYCENCQGLDLARFLDKYTEIKIHGLCSMLYVLNTKILKLTKNQLDQLKFYGFSFN